MAKDVVFESERISRWEHNKRFVIPLIALGAILIAVIVAALIIRGSRGETFPGGEDTPYPYVWTANKDGSVRLEINRSSAMAYQWAISPESTGIAVEEEAESGEETGMVILPVMSVKPDRTQSSENSAFLLTPMSSGRAVLTLDLARPGDGQDTIYQMTVLTEVLEDGGSLSTSLISINGTALQGVARGGEDTDFPYTVRLENPSTLLISVKDADVEANLDGGQEQPTEPAEGQGAEGPEEAPEPLEEGEPEESSAQPGVVVIRSRLAWECTTDREEVAEVLGVIYNADDVSAYVGAGTEAGRCTVRMASNGIGAAIVVECEVLEDGTITILSHNIAVDEPVENTSGEAPPMPGVVTVWPPVLEEPEAEEPIAEAPAAEEPIAEAPAAEEPAA